MTKKRTTDRLQHGLVQLLPVKRKFLAASERAAVEVRSCEGCDARCCKVGRNSMRVSRLEAVALAGRLREPDLAPLVPEILERAKREVRERKLAENETATYDCPLLSEEGRCLVHGPAQPAGCHTYQPVDDGGCDHDLEFFQRNIKKIGKLEKRAFGREFSPLTIPEALLKAVRE